MAGRAADSPSGPPADAGADGGARRRAGPADRAEAGSDDDLAAVRPVPADTAPADTVAATRLPVPPVRPAPPASPGRGRGRRGRARPGRDRGGPGAGISGDVGTIGGTPGRRGGSSAMGGRASPGAACGGDAGGSTTSPTTNAATPTTPARPRAPATPIRVGARRAGRAGDPGERPEHAQRAAPGDGELARARVEGQRAGGAAGRQVADEPGAEHERRHDGADHAGVDVAQLVGERAALAALGEVRLDPLRLPAGEPAAGVGAELLAGLAVAPVPPSGPGREVFLQVGLPQPLPRAVAERGDGVGGQAEQRRDVGRAVALDLEVPEHRLPALGQRRERPRGEGALEPGERGVGERDDRAVGVDAVDVGDVVGEVEAALGAAAVVGEVPHRGQQVRPERLGGAATGAQDLEHARERARHEVVGVGGGAGELAGQGARGLLVAPVERREGVGGVPVGAAAAQAGDQLAVAAQVLPGTARQGVGVVSGSEASPTCPSSSCGIAPDHPLTRPAPPVRRSVSCSNRPNR